LCRKRSLARAIASTSATSSSESPA
jgi:hypothetical protein